MEDLKDNPSSIVLINPGVLLGSRPSRHGHFLVVKEVKSDSLIVNDPMPIFGGENRRLDLETPDERTHQLIKELAAGGTIQRV